MIDQGVFKNEWAILCQRFNRDFSDAVMARYYQSLSPRMSTEEFKAACRIVFDSLEFFPTPDQIVQATRASVEQLAADQWTKARASIRGGGTGDDMDLAGRRALAALGGARHLGQQPADELKWVRKEFVALYAEYARDADRGRHALPSGPDAADELLEGNPNLIRRLR